jgi:prepilin-type N-terminal cleavage/methylation domain-containing protein
MIKHDQGFTLVEILVAMAIGLIMLTAIYTAVNTAQRSTSGIERKVVAQQDARAALELMAMEIRMASYDRNMDNAIWVNPASTAATPCFSTSPNPTYKGIQEATPFAITVEMDINDNGIIDNTPNNSNETIKYVYQAASQYITRSTNCGSAQPFLGDNPTSGRPLSTRVVNDQNGNGLYDTGIDVPIFRYYDGAGTEILPANLPASIPNIRVIEITLVVETEDVDPASNQRRRMVYSTRIIPRNHGIKQ